MQIEDSVIKELISKSKKATEFSYCPYSKYPVGAALLTSDGTTYTGCNIENASYPNGICAERTALCKAVSEGHRDFIAIAISSKMQVPIVPCGFCRQVLAEFGLDLKVYMTSPSGYEMKTIRELLPLAFTPNHIVEFNKS